MQVSLSILFKFCSFVRLSTIVQFLFTTRALDRYLGNNPVAAGTAAGADGSSVGSGGAASTMLWLSRAAGRRSPSWRRSGDPQQSRRGTSRREREGRGARSAPLPGCMFAAVMVNVGGAGSVLWRGSQVKAAAAAMDIVGHCNRHWQRTGPQPPRPKACFHWHLFYFIESVF